MNKLSDQIPKTFYSYWDGSPLSFMHYLTVKTFQELNPSWKIVIYQPMHRFHRTTPTNKHNQFPYQGYDYWPKVLDLGIEIRKLDFETIGFTNNMPEVCKSDIFRLWAVGTFGGMWSDMDIFYLKPIEDLLANEDLSRVYGDREKLDMVICHDEYFPVALFLSKPNNKALLDTLEHAKNNISLAHYQSYGVSLWSQILKNPQHIKTKYPDLNVYNMKRDVYLPYIFNQVYKIWLNSAPQHIKSHTVGIHWFNGNANTQKVLNLDPSEIPTSGTIYPFLKSYLNEQEQKQEQEQEQEQEQ